MNTIGVVPAGAWTAGIDQNGDTVHDTFVAERTGLLDLDGWHDMISGLRVIVLTSRCTPLPQRATEREKQLRRRYQLIATNTRHGQIAWLDARHRSHIHVENDVNRPRASA